MYISIGLLCTIAFHLTNAQTQQTILQSTNTVINSQQQQQQQNQDQLQHQIQQQHNLFTGPSYGELEKIKQNLTNNAAVIINRIGASEQTTILTDKIYQLPPQKHFNEEKNKQEETLPIGPQIPTHFDALFKLDDHFDWNLIKHMLSQKPNQNVIVSPFSIKVILSLLLEATGANSDSNKELFQVLTNVTRNVDNISNYWKKTVESLKTPSEYHKILFGTRMFVDEYVSPQQKYRAKLEEFYGTDVEALDFHNTSYSANIINQWSSESTAGHIRNIVSESQLSNAVILLLNAIYFQGKWKYSFDPKESFPGEFYYEPQKTNTVEYITKRDYYNFMDSNKLNAKILQIPYAGDRYHLTILLPKAKAGLDQLIEDLSLNAFKRLQWSADDEIEVKITIPKLSFTYESSLKDSLNALGVNEIFSDNASLPLLDRGSHLNTRLKVSDIYQKSGLKIDEFGTTAYAETVAALENKFGGSIEEFNANRPFLFLIQDTKDDNILFAGKILNPKL